MLRDSPRKHLLVGSTDMKLADPLYPPQIKSSEDLQNQNLSPLPPDPVTLNCQHPCLLCQSCKAMKEPPGMAQSSSQQAVNTTASHRQVQGMRKEEKSPIMHLKVYVHPRYKALYSLE